jgi:hypothetical protein
MIAAIIAFINMIPGINTLVATITTAYFNSKVQLTQARIGGDTAVAIATVKAVAIAEESRVNALRVIGGSWILSFLTLGFAVPWIAYEWKVVVWDTMLGWGTTPAIHGAVGDWATTIIACLFGSGAVLSAGHMYFNRDKRGE